MQVVLAILVSTVLILIGLVHLYWLFGGRKGMYAALPTRPGSSGAPSFMPGRFETAAVIVLFWASALLVLMYAEVMPTIGPASLPRFTSWGLVFVFAIRAIGEFHYLGLFKKYRSSPFGRLDSYVYSPLCLVLAGLTGWMVVIGAS